MNLSLDAGVGGAFREESWLFEFDSAERVLSFSPSAVFAALPA
jgi:hypothetical protein